MLTPVTDLIYGALAEIRVARGGDVVRAEDQALCLTFLNEILERLAVTPHALYAEQAVYAALGPVAPGVPHTIGPTGGFLVARRPAQIRRAWFGALGGPNQPIPLQSEAWLLGQTAPWQTGPMPEGVYYNPTWPDGALYFWPLPAVVWQVGLVITIEIAAVVDTDTIDLPPGYGELLRLWTAKKAAPSFAREFSSASQAALTECVADVFGTNTGRVNDLDTRDGGVPGARGGTYDAQTGLVR